MKTKFKTSRTVAAAVASIALALGAFTFVAPSASVTWSNDMPPSSRRLREFKPITTLTSQGTLPLIARPRSEFTKTHTRQMTGEMRGYLRFGSLLVKAINDGTK